MADGSWICEHCGEVDFGGREQAAYIDQAWRAGLTWAEISRKVDLPPEECQRIYEERRASAAYPALSELDAFGNARIRSRRLAEGELGGSVVLQIAAVHTHACPYWRNGKSHGPCECGANEAWDRWIETANV